MHKFLLAGMVLLGTAGAAEWRVGLNTYFSSYQEAPVIDYLGGDASLGYPLFKGRVLGRTTLGISLPLNLESYAQRYMAINMNQDFLSTGTEYFGLGFGTTIALNSSVDPMVAAFSGIMGTHIRATVGKTVNRWQFEGYGSLAVSGFEVGCKATYLINP